MLRKNVGAILSFIFVLIILHETESDTCSLHSFFILERQESWETTSGTVLQEAHVCVFAKQNGGVHPRGVRGRQGLIAHKF